MFAEQMRPVPKETHLRPGKMNFILIPAQIQTLQSNRTESRRGQVAGTKATQVVSGRACMQTQVCLTLSFPASPRVPLASQALSGPECATQTRRPSALTQQVCRLPARLLLFWVWQFCREFLRDHDGGQRAEIMVGL